MSEPISYSFTLTQQDYVDFNIILSGLRMGASRKRMFAFGMVEVTVSVVLGVALLVGHSSDILLFLLDALILLFGLNSLFYFKLFFPLVLKRAVRKNFNENPAAFGVMTVTLDENGVHEIGALKDNTVRWEDIAGIYKTKSQYFFMVEQARGVILPKRAVEDVERLNVYIHENRKRANTSLPVRES